MYHSIPSPKLSLEPISFSLTEGTSIPAPVHTPPESLKDFAIPRLHQESVSCQQQSAVGGPLSSHPVTPIEQPAGSQSYPFGNRPPSRMDMAGQETSSKLQSSQSPAATPTTPPYANGEGRPRQASFASKFFRLRSFSSLRSFTSKPNESQLTLAHQPEDSNYTPSQSLRGSQEQNYMTSRGVKRPIDQSASPYSAAGSQSFPRMVRKKSMDMLSTMKRKSGMWSSSMDLNKAFEEEAARERMREEEDDASMQDEKNRRLAEQLMAKDPAPQLRLQGLDGGELDGLKRELLGLGRTDGYRM